jgi:serine protease AprX
MKIRLLPLALVAGLATLLASGTVALGGSTAVSPTVGLDRLDASFSPAAVARGIATFDAVPTAANVAALQAFGLTVQPMKHLPLALVRGPVASIDAAVHGGAANDVYPDEDPALRQGLGRCDGRRAAALERLDGQGRDRGGRGLGLRR